MAASLFRNEVVPKKPRLATLFQGSRVSKNSISSLTESERDLASLRSFCSRSVDGFGKTEAAVVVVVVTLFVHYNNNQQQQHYPYYVLHHLSSALDHVEAELEVVSHLTQQQFFDLFLCSGVDQVRLRDLV
jgi:hypothetical protein